MMNTLITRFVPKDKSFHTVQPPEIDTDNMLPILNSEKIILY